MAYYDLTPQIYAIKDAKEYDDIAHKIIKDHPQLLVISLIIKSKSVTVPVK